MQNNDKTYSPSHVANYFFERSEKDKNPITPLKLNKLVYIAYGWVAGALHRKLFDEEIQAWTYGPVIPSLYNEFKHFKDKPITERSAYMPDPSYPNFDELSEPSIDKNDEDVVLLLDKVWKFYGDKTAASLVKFTHKEDSPWYKAYDGNHGKPIPYEEIEKYFENYLKAIFQTEEGNVGDAKSS